MTGWMQRGLREASAPRRVVWLGVTLACIVLAHFAVSTWLDYGETLDRGWLTAERTVRVLEEQVTQTFNASRLVTDRVIDLSRHHGIGYFNSPQGWNELHILAEVVPQVGSIWVTDAAANVVASSIDQTPPPANIADREYIRTIMAGAPLAIGGLASGRVINVRFFSYNRPILIDDRLQGIVQTSIHGEAYQDFYEHQQLGPGATISLYRLDGAVFMRWPMSDADIGATIAGTPLFEDLRRKSAGRMEVASDVGPLMQAYRRVGDLPVVATAALSRRHVLAPFRDRLFRNAALLGLSLLVIAAFTASATVAMRREDRLREATARKEERLRLATNGAALGVFEWEAETDCAYWENARMYEIFGRDPDLGPMPMAQLISEVIDDGDAPAFEGALAAAAGHGGTFHQVCRFRRADDPGHRWLEMLAEMRPGSGRQPPKLVGVLADITERQRGEQQLRQSEERYRLLVEQAADGIFVSDARGHYSDVNAAGCQMLGYSRQEILGLHILDVIAADEKPRLAPELAKLGNGEVVRSTWRFRRKDGSSFTGEVAARRLPNGDFQAFLRDVTAQKEAEAALAEWNARLEQKVQEAARQLVQLQKTEAIGRLTGGVAHDFNNLLMAIVVNLEVLKARLPPDDEPAARLIENALAGVKRGSTLTQRMLAFARRQDLEPAPVSLPDLVAGMSDLLARTLGPQIHLETRFAPGLPKAMVDANQLELAILNLAVNGRDAMPEGGCLTIAVDTRRLGPQDRLPAGDYLQLTVADSGSGMDEETLAKAVEPFYTTKGVGKGTGLGLPMVQGLAEQSGGLLCLHSTPGQGTSAEILLPVATAGSSDGDGTTGDDVIPAIRAPADAAPGLSVLVVDDDDLVLSGIVAVLEALGHVAHPATSGAEALALLHRGAAIDVVVTDQGMPGMTGVHLAQTIHRDWPELPLVLTTGYGELPKEWESQFVARLNKPFRPDTLAATLAKAAAMRCVV
jgi:PAS domain S-box-containing protein